MKKIVLTIALFIYSIPNYSQSVDFNINLLGGAKEKTASISSGDIDNDGDVDIIIANGRHWPGQNKILFNNGKGGFTVERDLGLERLTSYAAELSDFDGDGDLDIVMNGFNESVRIYRNNIAGKNVIRIILEGKESNKNGIGARVELKYNNNSKSLLRYLSSSRGFMSSSESVIHFGLGIYEKADKITIKWPSGNIQVLENIPTGYVYTISEINNSTEIDEDNVLMFTKDTG